MSLARKVENKKCFKCNSENVYRHEFLTPPVERHLEEGKIIVGVFIRYLKCDSCSEIEEEPEEKLYSNDIYT